MAKGFGGNIRRLDLRETLRSAKDTKNFDIDKGTRFAARFFQFILAIMVLAFAGSISNDMFGSWSSFIMFLAVTGLLATTWNVIVYALPWLFKAWSSRRIILVETFFDCFYVTLWIVCAIGTATVVGANALLDENQIDIGRCRWLVVFCFLLLITWIVNFALDVWAIYKGMMKSADVDPEALLEIRRSARGRV